MNTAAVRQPDWRWLDVGGQPWAVRTTDEGAALEVALPEGMVAPQATVLRWPCWCYADHLLGLRAGLSVGPAAAAASGSPLPLVLDPAAYLAGLTAWAALDDAARDRLQPLALWWTGGGDPLSASAPDGQGRTEIGGRAFQLRRWTHRERLASLLRCVDEDRPAIDGARFDAVAYLDAMVRRAVAPALFDDALDQLPARWALPLIDAVVAWNLAPPDADLLPTAGPLAQAAAVQTLRLCRALGWTPSQVWAAPAAEIDRLQALLDLAQPAAPAASVRPPAAPRRLADHPDAVVIRIDD